ncbi:MAG: hypothetical protein Q8Q85_01300, partial [Gemmatimonadales bacterium]|nr:hypothetical protein [Gemmatimonadales bacterium]
HEPEQAPPRHRGVLYSRALFPEIQAMDGHGCGKRVVKAHRGESVVLSWPAHALSDLDVPEDYERALGRLAMR